MDTKRIGKFIAENRKKKELTQAQLAEKLGVTSKTVSRWENGNYMPDISLLKPLSEELEISLNDLLSGEKVGHENYQDKLEENILNTIDYTNKKTSGNSDLPGLLLLLSGTVVTMIAMTVIPPENSLGGVYSVIGVIIAVLGAARLARRTKTVKRFTICAVFLIASLGFLFGIDYLGVVNMRQASRFTTNVSATWVNNRKIVVYDGPFYDVVRINADTEKEIFRVVGNDSLRDIVYNINMTADEKADNAIAEIRISIDEYRDTGN
ncbi:MAG: helix-turn-helix domain-containing protein [Clostridiales bacterium]|nr:helix-turn-helix domain-containing protein [Clostridiales bacterium]